MGYYSRYYYPSAEETVTAGVDLFTAIKEKIAGTAIDAAFGSRYYYGSASRKLVYPYLLIKDGGSVLILKTSTSTLQTTTIQFQVYGGTLDNSALLANQNDLFWKNATVSFDGGWTGPWDAGDRRSVRDDIITGGGNEVWYIQSEFKFLTNRSGA